MHNEIIKEIKEFPGYYVSDKGTVYSTKWGKDLKPLAPETKKSGYLEVCLRVGGKQFNKRVHRLVAEAFLPNPDNLPQVNHLDECKTNNSVENLAWCTNAENSRYSNCKPVIDLMTGAIYPSAVDASRSLNANDTAIGSRLNDSAGWYKGHQFMFLRKATEESVNTIELFGKKFEIPEVFTVEDLFSDYELYDN